MYIPHLKDHVLRRVIRLDVNTMKDPARRRAIDIPL
jgi:hypothetical protein